MDRKPDPEDVRKVLSELEGQILVVEGKKDEKALMSLVSAEILKVNSRPLPDVAEGVDSLREKHKNREVIVLTDFDRKGRRLASRLTLFLQRHKIHANSRIRRDVMNLGICRIEEMASLTGAGPGEKRSRCASSSVSRISKKERDDYGQTGPNFYEICDKSADKGKRRDREARRDRRYIRAD